jgi:hypothetical protein
MTTPTYLPFYILIGSITIITAILIGLHNGWLRPTGPNAIALLQSGSSLPFSLAGSCSPLGSDWRASTK